MVLTKSGMIVTTEANPIPKPKKAPSRRFTVVLWRKDRSNSGFIAPRPVFFSSALADVVIRSSIHVFDSCSGKVDARWQREVFRSTQLRIPSNTAPGHCHSGDVHSIWPVRCVIPDAGRRAACCHNEMAASKSFWRLRIEARRPKA